MKTVGRMIEELKIFPLDAECYAYEGEDIGLVIEKDGKEIGFIPCYDVYGKGTKRYDVYGYEKGTDRDILNDGWKN